MADGQLVAKPLRYIFLVTGCNYAPILSLAYMHKPKFEFFLFSFANLLGNFVLALLLSFAFLIVSSFLCFSFQWNCGWLTFLESGKLNMERVATWTEKIAVYFPQKCLKGFCVTLAGLVIVSKMRYLWKDLSFLNSLLITLIVILKAKWVQKCIIYIIA